MAFLVIAIAGLEAVSSNLAAAEAYKPVSTRLLSQFAKQAKIAQSISVKKKIDSLVSAAEASTKMGERRNLQFGHYKVHDHCHNVFHEAHNWWDYDHGDAIKDDDGKWIPNREVGVEYCDVTSGTLASPNGGYGPVCKCPWMGYRGLVLRNAGTITLHTIEVTLQKGGRQLAFSTKEHLDFGPGQELRIGEDNWQKWDWTSADSLMINGNYNDPTSGKMSGFWTMNIEICNEYQSVSNVNSTDSTKKNPIGTVDSVHLDNKDGAVLHDDIKLSIVGVFDAEHPDQELCSDGWVQCSKLRDGTY